MTKATYLQSLCPYGSEPCRMCKGPNHPYMIKDSLWYSLFPESKGNESKWHFYNGKLVLTSGSSFFVCIPCVEAKLSRPLTMEDFSTAPINFETYGGFDCRKYCSL